MKKEEAITLISLVVTIIVLLILSGITLNFILGENGIIEKSKLAKEKYENSVNEEHNILSIYYPNDNNIESNESQENTELQEFKTIIASTITELGIYTLPTQSTDDIISNINKMANNNYEEGKQSDLVLVKTDLSSRYVQNISLSNIEGYENLTEDDIIIVNKYMSYANVNEGEGYYTMSKSYDKQTGNLTLGKLKSYNVKWTFWNVYDLYIIRRNTQAIQQKETLEQLSSKIDNIELLQFKTKLAEVFENYGIENTEENPITNKTAGDMSNDLRSIARKKYEEGIATYMIPIQKSLNSRYNQSVSANHIQDYQDFTINDCIITIEELCYANGSDGENILNMAKSYDQTSGTLSFGKQKSYTSDSNSRWTFFNIYNAYLLKKDIIDLSSN